MPSSDRLLILGATGQLGSDLVRAAEARNTDHVAVGHDAADVTQRDAVAALIARVQPTVVINPAAFHQVDRCEDDPQQAFQVNAVGAFLVARAATAANARTVYVSTDYVFPGTRPPAPDGRSAPATAYVETDVPEPLNVYGVSKHAGEQAVSAAAPDHLIVRVASLFGISGARGKGGNFIETILKKAKEGGPLRVVDDQWMSPTATRDAADAILDLVQRAATGVVHVVNEGQCTWHAFASAAVRLAGLSVPVEPVPAEAYPAKARRPRNSALATERLRTLLGSPLRTWPDALEAYLVAKGHRT